MRCRRGTPYRLWDGIVLDDPTRPEGHRVTENDNSFQDRIVSMGENSISGDPVFYVDCDPGIDDALALIYLIKCHADLRGIGAVAGNVAVDQAAENARRWLALTGRPDIPVAVGRQEPMTGEFWGGAQWIHGPNGFAGLDLPPSQTPTDHMAAAERLVATAHEIGSRLHIIALGPLTNIAVALAIDETLPETAGAITIMGGAHLVPGNVSPHAEANIFADPVAASQVFSAPWRNLTLVPLDITNNHSLSRADVDLLQTASTDPAVQLAATMLAYYLDRHPEFDHSKCLLHDPLAAAIALGSVSLNESPSCTISVETDGEHRGRTLVTFDEDASPDTSASRHRIALSATADFGPLLMSALLPNAQTLREPDAQIIFLPSCPQ